MTWLTVLQFLGIPAVFSAKAVKLGVQAMLRAQMISEYNKAKDKGYAPIYSKDNFENMWKQYHNLGMNGVMDAIRDDYMSLPNRKEEALNEHQNQT